MSYYAPKPLRPEATNPLFTMNDSYTVVKSFMTPIQRQRSLDGSPITTTPRTALRPEGERIYLGGDHITKSVSCDEKPQPDPDEVMKSYLARG